MCGIAGVTRLSGHPVPELERRLAAMNQLQRHRGPDGEGIWVHPAGIAGFAHRRLSIIDLTTGQQPMADSGGNWITYNGEIYNYSELRRELGVGRFRTSSDTEVILKATASGASIASITCAGCSRSRSGTNRIGASTAPAIASGSSRSTTASPATSCTLPRKPRPCCRFCPGSRPISRPSRST